MTWLRQRFAPGYDLFKLLVAVILIIILILSLRARQAASKSQTVDTSTSASTATQVPTPLATRTQAPTLTSSPQPDTPVPTFTPQPATPTATPLAATEMPTVTALPPTSEPTSSADSGCPSLQSRIKIGDNVRVMLRLNFRKGPGLEYPIIQTNGVGTNLEVIGGPICTVRTTSMGSKAYLWWNVRMASGMEGWSAEAPLVNSFYFLDPVK